MGAKPTVTDARVRQKIREVLNMAPGYGKTETMLLEFVNELTGGGVEIEQLRAGIEWNHGQDYVRRHVNEDTDEVEWFITKHGIAKETLK